MVNNGEEAQRVVDAVKYVPMGKRGLAAARASDWGLGSGGLPSYVERANRETFITVQVETREAIEKIDELLQIEAIDMIFFGPSDLSTALDMPGQATHPNIIALIEELGERAQRAGKITGTIGRDGDAMRHWRDRGFQFICTGVNNLFVAGIQSYLDSARG